MSQYKPVSRLLTSSTGNLQSMLERAHYLQTLTRLLQNSFDPTFSQHITLVNLRHDTAIVAADTPAWLSKIRYLAPAILTVLRQQPGLSKLHKLQFKVQPMEDTHSTSQANRRATLSMDSSKILESAASGISDPDLANALQRLSRQRSNHSS
jgi:hypothetical protein